MDMAHGVGLLGAAAGAGGVDAIVGGGGLIQLPALLLAYPTLPAAAALGTNKLASISGTSTAAATYLRRTKVDRRVMIPAAALAVVCAGFGAVSASRLPTSVFRPIVMALLVCVAMFVVFRPSSAPRRRAWRRHRAAAWPRPWRRASESASTTASSAPAPAHS